MLIIANGAFKSGSTWQFRILRELTQYAPIPKEYQTDWVNPSLDIDRISAFLDEVDIATHNHISKNHLSSLRLRDMLLANKHVRVFNIERDIRDVLVSAYYHYMRKNEATLSFADYMEQTGFQVAGNVLSYHQTWNAPQSSRYFLGSYEGLHNHFNAEVQAMATFLNRDINDEQIKAIKQQTTIGKLREVYNEADKMETERFFRKGEIGDWVNYFDDDLLERLQTIQEGYQIDPTLMSKIRANVKQWLRR